MGTTALPKGPPRHPQPSSTPTLDSLVDLPNERCLLLLVLVPWPKHVGRRFVHNDPPTQPYIPWRALPQCVSYCVISWSPGLFVKHRRSHKRPIPTASYVSRRAVSKVWIAAWLLDYFGKQSASNARG